MLFGKREQSCWVVLAVSVSGLVVPVAKAQVRPPKATRPEIIDKKITARFFSFASYHITSIKSPQ